MTLFHFGNCIALAFVPYFLSYKYSGLSEASALWRCGKVGGVYFLTQLSKLFLIALLFPVSDGTADGTEEDTVDSFMLNTAYLVDYVGLYFAVTRVVGKGEMKVMATAVGWGTAQLIATRVLPLWMGARGTEFDWKYMQSALGANIELVNHLTVAALLSLWSRNDIRRSVILVTTCLLAVLCYKHSITLLFKVCLGLGSWQLVAADAVLSGIVALAALRLPHAN